jgi:hypothetical protein
MVQGMTNGSFRNFVEHNAGRRGRREAQQKTDRIRNHFTLSFIVGGKIDAGLRFLLESTLQCLDGFRFLFQPMIGWIWLG